MNITRQVRSFVLLSSISIRTSVKSFNTNLAKPFYLRSLLASSILNLSTMSNNQMTIDTDESSSQTLQVKLLSENATIPTRGSPLSAGFDLSSAEHTIIKAGQRGLVKTDLSIACPYGTYGRVAPRSGLAVKKFIDVGAGVIDADYRGPVGVVLFNFGTEDFVVNPGDRVAQLVLEKISMADIAVVDELDETVRGSGGFGSTGVSNDAKKQRIVSPTGES